MPPRGNIQVNFGRCLLRVSSSPFSIYHDVDDIDDDEDIMLHNDTCPLLFVFPDLLYNISDVQREDRLSTSPEIISLSSIVTICFDVR